MFNASPQPFAIFCTPTHTHTHIYIYIYIYILKSYESNYTLQSVRRVCKQKNV